MRMPILYALTYPERLTTDLPKLDLVKHNNLTFSEPDVIKFRNLSLAYTALEEGGNMPCIMNAANEIAVDAFLKEKIKFTQIPDVIEQTMRETEFSVFTELDLLEITDKNARTNTLNYINKLNNK